jgi:hypothetical protein
MTHLGTSNISYGQEKVKNQSTNLTPYHEKSGIALIYLCASGVLHVVEKLSIKVTTFL